MPEETVPTTVTDAVNAAAQEHGLVEDSVGNTGSANVETKETETAQVSETKVDDAQDQRTIRALNLLDQLEDVKGGPELVRAMAVQLGLLEGATTPKQTEKAANSLKARVIATLGEDYPILGEKIAGLLEDITNEQEQKFAHEINSRERARYEADVDRRIVSFIAEHKVTEAEQAEITKLSSKFPPSPSVPPEEYLEHHLKFVRREQAEAKEKSRTNAKIKDNFASSPANRGVAGNEERIVKASKNLTPLQAVQMAARGESVSED